MHIMTDYDLSHYIDEGKWIMKTIIKADVRIFSPTLNFTFSYITVLWVLVIL